MNKFFNNNKDSHYYPTVGITNCKINMYNELIHNYAKIYFKIMDNSQLSYALFAGQSIGYLRNKENIPWVDDYDIIIFYEDVDKFMKEVVPIFKKHHFKCFSPSNHYRGGYHVLGDKIKKYHTGKSSYFQCDVFYSFFNRFEKLKNKQHWGLYHKKNIDKKYVLPFQRHKFHNDMELPFFNNIEEEVKQCYGNIYNICKIFTHSLSARHTYNSGWKKPYQEFNTMKETSINNTKKLIYLNDNYQPIKKLVVDDYNRKHFSNEIDILSYISLNNIGHICIFCVEFFKKYSLTIKFYFSKVKISFYLYEKKSDIIVHLNNVDNFYVKNNDIYDYYNDPDLIYINKPIIDYIQVITFGTFDLFHYGHENLFNRIFKYGDKVIVGLSTDDFTKEKKNFKPDDTYNIRAKNITDKYNIETIFEEKSLELKNDYIKKYNGNILIMGDDWKDKFDWVDICVIYLPRTPNISSTMIKQGLL